MRHGKHEPIPAENRASESGIADTILNGSRGKRRRIFRVSRKGFAVFILSACLCGWILGRPMMRAAARLWIVSDPPTQADVIVIPGGQIATRPTKAAELYRAGRAPLVYVMREIHNPILHQTSDRSGEVAAILEREGVPDKAIIFSEVVVKSTKEEADDFANWAGSHPIPGRPLRIIIVTDAFHSRRARLGFRRALGTAGIFVAVVPHRKYETDSWWTSNFGIEDFTSEVAKTAFYFLPVMLNRPSSDPDFRSIR